MTSVRGTAVPVDSDGLSQALTLRNRADSLPEGMPNTMDGSAGPGAAGTEGRKPRKRSVAFAYRVADLFCGCGGMSIGVANAGFPVVAAFDAWRPAIDAYNDIHKGGGANRSDAFLMDLSDVDSAVDALRFVKPAVIVGGPPCQDFSSAGRREEGDRANLTTAFARIVDGVRPYAFLMENVAAAQDRPAYHRAREIFKRAGYGLTERVVDASQCGVPQRRERFFALGMRRAPDGFADKELDARIRPTRTSVSDYWLEVTGRVPDFERIYMIPTNYKRKAVHWVHGPAPTVRRLIRGMPANYRLDNWAGCNDGDRIEGEIHSLSVRDMLRLQSFPEWVELSGNKADVGLLIGNAVPPRLAQTVATALMAAIKASERDGRVGRDGLYVGPMPGTAVPALALPELSPALFEFGATAAEVPCRAEVRLLKAA